MNTASLILAIIGTLLTLLSVCVAIFAFYFNRKKDSNNEGQFRGEVMTILKNLDEGIKDLKSDNENIKKSVDDLKEKYYTLNAKVEATDAKIDILNRIKEVTHSD